MSRNTTPGTDFFSWKTAPTRLKILPLAVVYQNRSADWYSIAVMSGSPRDLWVKRRPERHRLAGVCGAFAG